MEALLSVCLLDIWIMVVGVLEVMNEIAEMEVFSFLSLAVGDVCDCLFSHLDAWCFAGLFSSLLFTMGIRKSRRSRGDGGWMRGVGSTPHPAFFRVAA